jgi:mycothiol synthase
MLEHLPHGYRARPARVSDAESLTALFNACSRAVVGVDEHDVADLLVEWRSPGFSPDSDTILVETADGSPAGYAEVWDTDEPHVRVFSWGRVDPGHRGLGIGAWLAAWEEERARKTIGRAPAGARVSLRQFVYKQDSEANALLERRGYALVRLFFRMEAPLDAAVPEPTWPEGVSVRTFNPDDDLEPVVRAIREAFRDHWGHVESSFEEELENWRHWITEDKDFDPSLWFLATADGQIAGVTLCSPKAPGDPGLGYVNTVGVVRPWRRRGVALALLRHAFAELRSRGKERVALGVDSSSLTGALRLYELAGMRPVRESHVYEKELRPGRDLTRQNLEE